MQHDRRSRSHRFAIPTLLALALVTLPAAGQTGAEPPPSKARTTFAPAGAPVVTRVFYTEVEQLRDLSGFDLLEQSNRGQRYVLALLTAEERERVRELGFRTEIDVERTDDLYRPRSIDPLQTTGIPGYPCYRTVEETYATAQSIVADHPTLASYVDIGDSWEKQEGIGGYDLNALVLTNSAVPGPKPKLIATCAIHAREYTTAELCTRFAEKLVADYGHDADATWLLDYHEIHLVLIANPDGRKQAETGLSWRKNTNQNYCSPTSSSRGADLNRNWEFQWGCCGGSSGDECSPVYRGPSPSSEPEVQAYQAYLRAQFPDQREDDLTAPAPADATGIYLDVHASGRLIIWPWGFTATTPPNSTALQTLGRKLAYFNGHEPSQAIDLYPTDGTTADFGYGDLGVASFVYELGTSFFQDCSSFEGTILPDNLQSLKYAAKVVRTPYLTPAGPDALEIAVTPALVDAGETVQATAVIDDGRYENGNGTEPSQSIASAEIYLDLPPWEAGVPLPLPMTAVDGSFDETVEAVTANLDTTGLTGGRHTVFVRGRDNAGNRGAISAFFFYVADGTEGSVSGVVTDADSGAPLEGMVSVPQLALSVATDPQSGAYSLELPVGTWDITATASLYLSQTVQLAVTASSSQAQDFALAPVPPILVVDDDDNSPDVRDAYTGALDALGAEYWIWDTGNSDNEPTALDLAPFESVIWFTGDEYGGACGPGSASEAALAQWLDTGGCIWIASQEYFYDRGLTQFMQSRLGVASVDNDVSQATVSGRGSVFDGLGVWTLSFPYSNYTDRVSPDGTAELAFLGNQGDAAVNKDAGIYRSTYWGFGLETVPGADDRREAMARFLEWCGSEISDDLDNDGTPNDEDCAPVDPQLWSAPGPARDLTLTRWGLGNVAWAEPQEPGAMTLGYDLLRVHGTGGFDNPVCRVSNVSGTATTDTDAPLPGGLYCYLVRAENACGASMGSVSNGAPRTGPECP